MPRCLFTFIDEEVNSFEQQFSKCMRLVNRSECMSLVTFGVFVFMCKRMVQYVGENRLALS